ncbi:hypothetical protein EYC84_011181 [Monilinia fructicola]|uniref:Uncharacterized protein n=1 Tax=Monilinia fructicola TaxID=38448 RepID=A0A5M9JA80_MONFR|nr:hypothetical protein EYC84_011181 [Monilinia fructicola]
MSSSEPLPPKHYHDSPSLPVPSPITDRSSRPGPATRLLNDLFDEMDQLDTPESIDSSYIVIAASSHAPSRARSRTETSNLVLDSQYISSQPPTSRSSMTPDQQDDSPLTHFRHHVNSTEDLLELTSKIKEIRTRNGPFVNGNPEFISNSFPNPKLRSSLRSKASTNSREEHRTMIQKLKETFESSQFLTGAQMRAMAPKVFYTPAPKQGTKGKGRGKEKVNLEVDEMEEKAVEILEALFGELNERDAGSSEDEWKTADQLIVGVVNKNNSEDDNDGKNKNKKKNKDKGKGKEVEAENIVDINHSIEYEEGETSAQTSLTAKTKDPEPPELNINLFDEENSDDDDEHLAQVQHDINMSLRHTNFERTAEDTDPPQEHTPRSSPGASDETSSAQYGSRDEETSTHSPHDIPEHFPIAHLHAIAEHEEEIDGWDKSGSEKSFSTAPSIQLHAQDAGTHEKDTELGDEWSDADIEDCTPPESVIDGSDTSSSAVSSADDGAGENDLQLGMAALATGVMAASLWMIERRMGIC